MTLELIKEVKTLPLDEKMINKLWNDVLKSFGTDFDFLEILSRGSSMTTAHQASLNFKEIAKSYSEANSISTFRHGGIECLNKNTKFLIFTSDTKNLDLNRKFLKNLIEEWECDKILHIKNQGFDKEMETLHKNPKFITYKHPMSTFLSKNLGINSSESMQETFLPADCILILVKVK